MFGFDEIFNILLKEIIHTGIGFGTQALSRAAFGGPGQGSPGAGYGAPSGGGAAQGSPGVAGAGTGTRPSSMNFTGGYTGAPAGTGNGGQASEGGGFQGGFRAPAQPQRRPGFEGI